MNSYLSVLKRTLFSLSEPTAPPTTSENAKALKENWIYIHSETNSTTDEVINLNETFDKIANGDLNNSISKINDELAEEIRRNREMWLKKRISSSGKYGGSATSNIKRTKLNINKNRKRTSNSASSNSNLNLNPELQNQTKNCDNTSLASDQLSVGSNQEKTETSEDKKKVFANSTNHSPKLKMAKRSKLQGKHKPYSRVRTLNQPAAKGMC